MKNTNLKRILYLVLIISFFSYYSPFISAQYNYEYKNVTTVVNVTNSFPEILDILIDQDITLNAGGFKTVYCNASIRDWNGWDDVSLVNATFYHSTSSHDALDNGNSHYTNSSCANVNNIGPYVAIYECSFEIIHYANNGSWTCNVTAQDTFNFSNNLSNVTSINELYAINVTDIIDYGNLTVTETSSEVIANITNLGNMAIGVDVLGYGAVEGDGFGLICALGGNIDVEHQRFSSVSNLWVDKTPLNSTNQDMSITIPQATDLSAPTFWETYWQLYVPPNPQGLCTGNLRFTAKAS
jgi:hypothetical protein